MKKVIYKRQNIFLAKGVNIIDALPGKTIIEYIEHIKKTNQNEINNNINFILDDNYEETILDENETNVIALLEEDEKIESVQFKIKLSDKDSIINNILNQAKSKITEKSITGIGLLATNTISEETKSRIEKLIEQQIDNDYIKVDWSDESTLTSLTTNKENHGKAKLSVIENGEILKFETVDFSIIDISDSEKIVN